MQFPFKATKSLNLRCGIYRILHLPTGGSYVGSSINVMQRIGNHRSDLRKCNHSCKRLQELWDAGMLEDFAVEMLEECDPADSVLSEAENRWKEKLRELLLNPGQTIRRTSTISKPLTMSKTQRTNFLKRVALFTDSEACWPWPGETDGEYGLFGNRTAHRVSYFYHHGVDPGQQHVRHTCDNPICVNPTHLILGSAKDNQEDRSRRCRSKKGLTPELVDEVRLRYLSGEKLTDLNCEYGVTLNNVVRNRSFPDPDYTPPETIQSQTGGRPSTFSVEVASEVRRMSETGSTHQEICRRLALTQSVVNNILAGRYSSSETPEPLVGAICDLDEDDLERFWGMVKKTDTCWEWANPRGRFSLDGFKENAWRVAYAITHGRWPAPNVPVKRTCGSSLCVNPAHLTLGSKRYADMDWAKVREIRRLATETELTLREIGDIFGFADTGVRGIVNNTTNEFYDPEYTPPKRKTGPRGNRIVIYGEKKTLKEWADDPRCRVSYGTLKQRYQNGKRGLELLTQKQPAGRPVRPTSSPRKELMRQRRELILRLDADGLNFKEINEVLFEHEWKPTGPKEIASFTENFIIPYESLETLQTTLLGSEWACREKARELKLPLSVVLRYREEKAA
jgi:hypothetical protein